MKSKGALATLSGQFTVRPATLDDVEAAVELINACTIELTGEPRVSVQDVCSDWQQPGFDLETDTLLVFSPGGELVGHVELWDNEYVRIYVRGDVRPEFRGRGIGTALCRWAEERARQSIPKAPEGARIVLFQEAFNTDEAAQELLRRQGYQVVRHSFHMRVEMDGPPPEPAVPARLTIRPFICGQEERAMVMAVHEAFRDQWGFVERPFEQVYQEWMHLMETHPDVDPSLWFVAVDEQANEIAGTSFGHPTWGEDPEMGWIFGVGVRRPWRRRGLALALLQHCLAALYRRGRRTVGLGVDAQSLTGATRLYENAGMHVYRQFVHYGKELRPGEELSIQAVMG
jgi:mycothiol synthase